MLTAFRMPDDDHGGAGIFQHFSAEVASEGASDLCAAILAADGDAAGRRLHRTRNQRRRQADQNVGRWRRRLHRGGNSFDLAKLGRHPVHFPVSRD
jgi:hypothetical protein